MVVDLVYKNVYENVWYEIENLIYSLCTNYKWWSDSDKEISNTNRPRVKDYKDYFSNSLVVKGKGFKQIHPIQTWSENTNIEIIYTFGVECKKKPIELLPVR